MGIMSYRVRPQVGQEIRFGAGFPQTGGGQDVQSGADLLLRVRREADPDGVADALAQQAADADGGFQHPQAGGAGLGDSQVQGVVGLLDGACW